MASLPSNTFMFNYNARFYDPATYTFAKTKGQLFDEDLVLNTAPNSYTEDSVVITNGAYMGKTYSSNADNPFNRSSSLGNSFTFIYKTSGFIAYSNNLFANRNSNYNYMVRDNMFHTSSSGFLSLTPPNDPQICVIRINSNGTSERKFVDESGNTLAITTASTVSWGSINDGVAFFAGYANGGEYFNATFYWMYCSLETLTDEEVLKVIQWNENPSSFSISTVSETVTANGSSFNVDIESENPWTASTQSDWITLSSTTGSTDATITVTVAYNQFATRTGTVTFTDGEDTLTLTVTQQENNLIPIMKLYKNGRRIN